MCVFCALHVSSATVGEKTARKSRVAGGSIIDLEQVAREQQIRHQKQMEEILASLVAKHGEQLGDKLSLLIRGEGQTNGLSGTSSHCGTGSAAKDSAATVNDHKHQKQGEFNKVTGEVINALHCSK